MKIATERYRLELIVHHAEKLLELVRGLTDGGSPAVVIPIHHIEEVVRIINNHLHKEESK
jgi:hypothetical protein